MDDILDPTVAKQTSSGGEFQVPFDVVDLPSKGLLYKGTTLEGKTSLEVQYLTAIQEDILTSPNLINTGKMLEVLIKSVLKDKKIDPNELIIGDRNTIIVWLRSTGYGEKYPVSVGCRTCGESFENEFDLSTLDVKTLETLPDENGLFDFFLPKMKKSVKLKLLTCKEEDDVLKISESKKKSGFGINSALSTKLLYNIMEFDGNSDKGYIRKMIEIMPALDTREIRKYLDSIEPGVVMEQDATCTNCGATHKEVMPIRANFFWPDSGA